MIRLNRSNLAPLVLRKRGMEATQQDCEAYVRVPAAYRSGARGFEIIKRIYGSQKVREALKTLQHDKCCYCESRSFATSAGRIDHFRPNGAVRQSRNSDRTHPGYYWLAYRWDNLVLACETCNQNKSDYFPLEDPGQRARSHLEPLEKEAPLLLNPYVETDLREHLTFNGSACRFGTKRGRVTIDVLGLNRPSLQDERQHVLNILEALCTVACDQDGGDIGRSAARGVISALVRRDAPYSAMAHDYLRRRSVDVDIENKK